MKTKQIIGLVVISLLLFANFAEAQKEAFPNLKKMIVYERNGQSVFLKCPKSSKIIKKHLSELPRNHPMYFADDFEGRTLLAEVNLGSKRGVHYVVFSDGPSADPSFYLYPKANPKKLAISVGALHLFLPGNGNVYSTGHTNNLFNQRRKFVYRGGKFKELEQPFYWVGLKTKTLKPFKLYLDKNKSKVVGSIPKNYSIEVLVGEMKGSWLLIRTSFGLTGWIKVNPYGQPREIEGIYYSGD